MLILLAMHNFQLEDVVLSCVYRAVWYLFSRHAAGIEGGRRMEFKIRFLSSP